MTLTADQRLFLAQSWRYAEVNDPSIKARHPTAREAEYSSAFVTLLGATGAILTINAITTGDRRLVVATVDGVLPVVFRGRPPTCILRTSRYGYTLNPGRLMLVERADKDYGKRTTTLYLSG